VQSYVLGSFMLVLIGRLLSDDIDDIYILPPLASLSPFYKNKEKIVKYVVLNEMQSIVYCIEIMVKHMDISTKEPHSIKEYEVIMFMFVFIIMYFWLTMFVCFL